MSINEEAPTHASLAAALAGFQAERPRVIKDSINSDFGNTYASLDAFEAAVLPVLARHGLAWTCLPKIGLDNHVDGPAVMGLYVEYKLMHGASGEELCGRYPLGDGGPQQIGSVLTYAKRYLLSAVTGVSADPDDDAVAAEARRQRAKGEAPAGEVDWAGIIEKAKALTDPVELRKFQRARGIKRAPADVQAAFAAHVKSLTPTPEPAPAGEPEPAAEGETTGE